MVDLKTLSDVNENYKWLLNIIDCKSKFAWSIPCFTKTSKEVSVKLESLFYTSGPPEIIQTDNGTEFKGHVDDILKKFNVLHIRGRHPQSQGQIERFNQTLKRSLSKLLATEKDKCWLIHLEKAVYAYNIGVHRATNISPFKMFYGDKGFNTETKEDKDKPKSHLTTEEENKYNTFNENYLNKIVEHSYQNNPKYLFQVGDIVYVLKDIGTNARYNLKNLETACEPDEYVIYKSHSLNKVFIRKVATGETILIEKNRLKTARKYS